MKPNTHFILRNIAIPLLVVMFWWGPACSQALKGKPAPGFSLKDVQGKARTLNSLKNRPMVMLYFFDAGSRPSHAGLTALSELRAKYRHTDLQVWAITKSDKSEVDTFLSHHPLRFPVLMDDGTVSRQYGADRILPTTCILGPELKVMDQLQGGGKGTEVMLLRLAQRSLQHRKTGFARAVSQKVMEKNPDSVQARKINGIAALDQGKSDEAKIIFAELAQKGGNTQISGKEGLMAVAVKKGRVQEALNLAREVEAADPTRGTANVIKADILYSRNKKQAAEKEYEKAAAKKNTPPRQRAKAYNQLARIRADQGQLDEAKSLYDQAVAIDPYYIEATANKGLIYEQEGSWDQALSSYNKALNIDKQDTVTLALQKKLLAMMNLEQNRADKVRIDALVKDLAARYRGQDRKKRAAEDDPWTSRPMVLSFVHFNETGGLPVRDGFSTILTTQLAETLNESGRVKVVERVIVDKLLQELNLGSSELADPSTALKLGRVLSARLIGTGSLFYANGNYHMTLRLIDTETTRIAKVINADISGSGSARKDLHRINRRILATIMGKYPLQGYVVEADRENVTVNLGAVQGVVPGTRFDILSPGKPVVYRGKQLKGRPKAIGQVEIVTVDEAFSRGRILRTKRPLSQDDMLKEKQTDLTAGNGQPDPT